MRVRLSRRGVLEISPDRAVESYALRKWADDNMEKLGDTSGLVINTNIVHPAPYEPGDLVER